MKPTPEIKLIILSRKFLKSLFTFHSAKVNTQKIPVMPIVLYGSETGRTISQSWLKVSESTLVKKKIDLANDRAIINERRKRNRANSMIVLI